MHIFHYIYRPLVTQPYFKSHNQKNLRYISSCVEAHLLYGIKTIHKQNDYVVHTPMTANQVLEKAAEIVATRYLRGDVFTDP